MEEFIIFFVIVLMIISVMNIIKRNKDIIYVKSKTDGRKYLVRKLPDSQKAAEKLALWIRLLQGFLFSPN